MPLDSSWQWHYFLGPITILLLHVATYEIASFCIDTRLRQMAFLFVKVGKGWLSSYVGQRFWNKKAFCYFITIEVYTKQIDSMLPCICSVIEITEDVKMWWETSVIFSAIALSATFLFLPHFDVICDLLLNRCTATWNLFVNPFTPEGSPFDE